MSLAGRLPLVMAGVSAIAVLIAALVSWPLLNSVADSAARTTLARTADLTEQVVSEAMTWGGDPRTITGVRNQLRPLLDAQQVQAALVTTGAPVATPLRAEDVVAVTSGHDISDKRYVGTDAWYVEGRAVAPGTGVLLLQPAAVARDASSSALTRLIVSLLLGLAVAALAGYVLARRLTRPLVQAAAAANAMSSGHRDVRVDPEGPQEVADLAVALNRLAAALAESEDRQREFFLSVSHELRTPLTSIKGYAEALADGVVEPGDVVAVAGVVSSEADQLDRLVADLLDLARLGAVDVSIRPIDLDLAELGTEAASVWSDRAERAGVRFIDEVDRTACPVRTDPVRARQIIDNLMENALRVTGEDQPVVLRVGAGPIEGEFLLEVRDGGPGLTPDDRAVAFEPGELHRRYRGVRKVGSGVGLALVDRLAQRLGGRAEAGAASEGGATFRVVLPTRIDQPTQIDQDTRISPSRTPTTARQGAGPTTGG